VNTIMNIWVPLMWEIILPTQWLSTLRKTMHRGVGSCYLRGCDLAGTGSEWATMASHIGNTVEYSGSTAGTNRILQFSPM
jgi:hypothetical protein